MIEMNQKPKVSVIIPTYNRASLLRRSIQSVLNQTFQDFEIIVVDDCSTDNTEQVVKNFQEKDKRIRYIKHKENKGGAAARNSGIKASKGEFIGLLDDDDEWLPKKLEKQIKKFQLLKQSENVGVVYSGYFLVTDRTKKKISQIVPTLRGNVFNKLLSQCILGSPTPLIKKICFDKVGVFDETLPSCQDWDMWIRIAKYYSFDFVPDALAMHHIHGSQISVDLSAKIIGREKLIQKYKSDLLKSPESFSLILKRLAVLNFLIGEAKKGKKYLKESIKQYPFQKGVYIHFCFSVFAPNLYVNFLKKRNVENVDGIILYY